MSGTGGVQAVASRARSGTPIARERYDLLGAVSAAAVGIVLLSGLFVAVGYAIRGPLGAVRHWDATVGRWFFEQRTTTGNVVSHVATWLAETPTIVVIAIVAVVVLARRKRFHEVALLVGGLLVEFVTYLVVVTAVDRPRPAHQLETRFTGSFPSGHVAAAVTLYGLLAFIAARRIRSTYARFMLFVAPVLIVSLVAASRLYREMHHFSDVVAGALIGVGALVVASRVARHIPEPSRERSNP